MRLNAPDVAFQFNAFTYTAESFQIQLIDS
jgi:hypothetical protein